MEAIGYVRVSTTKQDYLRQVSEIKQHCQALNYELIKLDIPNDDPNEPNYCTDGIFSEKDSGKNDERKAYKKMLFYLMTHPDVQHLIVQELTRLGRTQDVLNTVDSLDNLKVCLTIIKPNLLTTLNPDKTINHNAKMVLNFLSGIAQFELVTLRTRMMSGLNEKRKKGLANGSLMQPFGYYKDKETKMLMVHPKEKLIIQDIFRMYIEGKGTRQIASYLNDEKIPNRTKELYDANKLSLVDKNGKPKDFSKRVGMFMWTSGTIVPMLQNPLYKGTRRRFYGRGKKNYEMSPYIDSLRIISDETFKAAKVRMESNINKRNHFIVNDYLIDNGKIFCGKCKNDQIYFSRRIQRRIDGKVIFYHNSYNCTTIQFRNMSCKNAGVPIDKLERLIQSVIISKYSKILEENISASQSKDDITKYESIIEQYKTQLEIQNKGKSRIVKLFVSDKITEEMYDMEVKPFDDSIKYNNSIITLNEQLLNQAKIEFENAVDVGNIKYNFNKKGERLNKDIVNKMVKKIVVTGVEFSSERIKNILNQLKLNFHFDQGNDRVILIDTYFGVVKMSYLLSQRRDYIFDLQAGRIRYTTDWDTIVRTENVNLKDKIEEYHEIKYTNSGAKLIRNNSPFDVLSYKIEDEKLKKLLDIKDVDESNDKSLVKSLIISKASIENSKKHLVV